MSCNNHYLLYFVTHTHLTKLAIFFKKFFKVFLGDLMPLSVKIKVNSVFEDVGAEVLETMRIIRNNGDGLSVSCRMGEGELTLVHPHAAQQALVAHVEDHIADMGATLFCLDDDI